MGMLFKKKKSIQMYNIDYNIKRIISYLAASVCLQ